MISIVKKVHEVHPVCQKPVPGRVRGHVLLDVLPVLNALFMVTAMKEFLGIVNEKGEPIGQVLARDTALKMLRQIGNGKSGPGVLRRYEI